MSHRFYVDSPIDGSRATLSGSEARHLAKVMRIKVGSEVTIFDGSGCEFSSTVTRINRDTVELDILASHEIDRELPFELTLGVALPKGDRQRWLIEKAVELGVTSVVPLITSRGVAQPTAAALRRLRRFVIEASKQCGRNCLMGVQEPSTTGEFVADAANDAHRFIADPNAESAAFDLEKQSPIYIAVGPEGGFTDDELSLATKNGFHSIALGPRILRVETAAISLAAQFAMRQ